MTSTPYPGLRPFLREEVDVFFGRDRHIDTMLSMLAKHRFLAVTGSSGAGKSSLVKTGLYSALELGYMRSAGAHWRIFETRPGSNPLRALCDALIEGLGTAATEAERGLMDAALARSPQAVVDALGVVAQRDGQSLLVVIDQFEELFRYRYDATDDESYAFVALLLALAKQRDVPIYVVITLRSDFLGECSRYDGLAEMVNTSLFLTPQMRRDELSEAIAAPASVFGGSVDERLIGRILNDIEKEQDQLPLMQHALAQLWERAVAKNPDAPALTLDNYDEIKGATGALSQHGDGILAELGLLAGLAEIIFRRLCGRSGGVRDIRRPTTMAELQSVSGAPMEDVVTVVEAFRRPDRSFLAPPNVELRPDTIIDITHESLIRQWGTLTAWAKAEADDEAIYRRIIESAQLHRDGRAALWKSPDLDIAVEWRDRVKPTRAWAERYGQGNDFDVALRFLSESTQEAKRQAETAENAEQERKDAQDAKRSARTNRRFAFVAIALTAIAVFWGFYAFNKQLEANDLAQVANEQGQKAIVANTAAQKSLMATLEAQGEAKRQADLAIAAEEEAKRQANLAIAAGEEANKRFTEAQTWKEQALRAQGFLLVEAARKAQQLGASDRAAAVAAEALTFAARYDAREQGLGLTPSVESGLSVVFSEIDRYPRIRLAAASWLSALPATSGFLNGDRFVAVENGDAEVLLTTFDRRSGAILGSAPIDEQPTIAAAAPDGSIIALGFDDHEVHLTYPLTAPQDIETFTAVEDEGVDVSEGDSEDPWIGAVSIGGAKDAMRLLTVSGKGEISLWDAAAGADRGEPLSRITGLLDPLFVIPLSAALSPDGENFALLASDGKVHIGKIENDTMSMLGVMRLSFTAWDSQDISIHLVFDEMGDRLIVLANNCLVGMSLTDTLPEGTDATSLGPVSACGANGELVSAIHSSQVFTSARLLDDGLTLALMGRTDAYLASTDAKSFGATSIMVAGEGRGPIVDFDPIGNWVVEGLSPSDLTHFPAPQPAFACANGCRTLARLDGQRLLLESASGVGVMTLGADGAPSFVPIETGGMTDLIGVRTDRQAVALADETLKRAVMVDFSGAEPVITEYRILSSAEGDGRGDGNEQSLTPGGAAADDAAPPTALDGLPTISQVKLMDGKTAIGDLFTYPDKGPWPSYLVPEGQHIGATSPGGIVAYETDASGVVIRLPDGNSGVADGGKMGSVAALAFGDDGALYALAETRTIWKLADPVRGSWAAVPINENAIYELFPEGSAGRMGELASMDVAGGEVTIVIDGAIKRIAIDGRPSWDSSRLDAGADWAGIVGGKLVSTAGVLSIWNWDFPNTTFAEGRLTAATMPGDTLGNLDLLELYVLPEALASSLGPRLGSEACAAEVARNRLMQSGTGCPLAVADDPANPRLLIADAMAMLTISASSSAPGDNGTNAGLDVGDLIVSDAHMLLIQTAAAGDAEALALIANELSPAIAPLRQSKLLPSTGWRETIAVLERIYEIKGQLPSALIALLADPSSETALAAARQRWLTRITEPDYADDPIAQLARIAQGDHAADGDAALAELASVIARLTGPSLLRAQGAALTLFAEMGEGRDPADMLAIMQAGAADIEQRPETSIEVAASLQAFIAATDDRMALAAARPEALRTAIVALSDLISGEDKAVIARSFVLGGLEVALMTGERGIDADQLLALVPVTDDAGIDVEAENALIGRLLTRIDLQSEELADLQAALLGRFAAHFRAQGTWDGNLVASAFETFAAVPGSDVAEDDKSWLSETENLFADNFTTDPDSGVYGADSANRADVNDRLARVAHIAVQLGNPENAIVMAGEAVIALETSGNEDVLLASLGTMQSAFDVLLEARAGWQDSEWLQQNWRGLLSAVRYAASELSEGMEVAKADELTQAAAALRKGIDLYEDMATLLLAAGPEAADQIESYDWLGYIEFRIGRRLVELGDEAGAETARLRATEAFLAELEAAETVEAENPTSADAATDVRWAHTWLATIEADSGDRADALRYERLGLDYARKAYANGDAAQAEELLRSFLNVSTYLTERGGVDDLAELAGFFTELSAMPPDARDEFPAEDIGEFLKNATYLVGSLAPAELPAADANQCDMLASHAYDPQRRAPGVLFESIDVVAAFDACQAALAEGTDDLSIGRAAYQMGRLLERADEAKIVLSIDPSTYETFYNQAAQLGYAMALNNLVPGTAADETYLPTRAGHFNAVIAAAGPAMAARLEAEGSESAKIVAAWLRSEAAAITDPESHRFYPLEVLEAPPTGERERGG